MRTMAQHKPVKTNAMRMLDTAGIRYAVREYEVDERDLSGERVAQTLGLDPAAVFKTLVLKGDKTGHVVACIPVAASLDLKALARHSGNKSVEMTHVKDLFALTGYIRGGCSPLGMKKKFPTYFDETILLVERVNVSAGQRGAQIELAPDDLLRVTDGQTAPLRMQR